MERNYSQKRIKGKVYRKGSEYRVRGKDLKLKL